MIDGEWETSRAENFIVVGNAWLTNRTELLAKLTRIDEFEIKRVFDGTANAPTDLRIIAELWETHGRRTPELLAGAYAFGVWERAQGTLWLVRDRVGAETLYYTREAGASAAVRYAGARLADVARGAAATAASAVDLVSVRDHLCCAFVPGERTMWRAVREVRPGTILPLPDTETTTYWRVEERIAETQLTLESYGALLRSCLEQVVRDCLPQRAPVSVYLSGRLDSSCVAALAARLHDHPVHTYSIHFGKECSNELEFSALVAHHCRTVHHVIEIFPDELWEKLPETIGYLDDSIGDPLTVSNLILGLAAKRTVNMILNGEGGDPCFGGPKNQPMLLTQLYRSLFELNEIGKRGEQSERGEPSEQERVA